MNRIVREHYPVDKLPQELREGLDPQARVTITIEPEADPADDTALERLFALRRDTFRSLEEVDYYVCKLRYEWSHRER